MLIIHKLTAFSLTKATEEEKCMQKLKAYSYSVLLTGDIFVSVPDSNNNRVI